MADDNPARWERYLRALERFGEPEEIDEILRDLGPPARVRERNAELQAMIERTRRWRWLTQAIREAAAWIVGVGAALGVLYGAYTFVAPSRDRAPSAEVRPE